MSYNEYQENCKSLLEKKDYELWTQEDMKLANNLLTNLLERVNTLEQDKQKYRTLLEMQNEDLLFWKEKACALRNMQNTSKVQLQRCKFDIRYLTKQNQRLYHEINCTVCENMKLQDENKEFEKHLKGYLITTAMLKDMLSNDLPTSSSTKIIKVETTTQDALLEDTQNENQAIDSHVLVDTQYDSVNGESHTKSHDVQTNIC